MDPEVIRRMRSSARYQWRRADIVRNEPLCRPCAEARFTVGAEHIDHIEPVHLAPERFWDRTNLQPLCRDCHERKHADERLTPAQIHEREAWRRAGSLSTKRSEPTIASGPHGHPRDPVAAEAQGERGAAGRSVC